MTAPIPRSDRCPKCGGLLEFRSDMHGYGRSVEQCTNPQCDYWDTFGLKVVIPAHTRKPRVEERPRRRRGTPPGPRSKTVQQLERVLALLPAAPGMTADEVAERIRQSTANTDRLLRLIVSAGKARRQPRHGVSRGRPPIEYWRAA